ncbi:hypothetical protein RKD20_001111 [Streptomyces sp. SLBN-8D4]
MCGSSLLSYPWGDWTCAFLTRQTQAWSHPVRDPGECSTRGSPCAPVGTRCGPPGAAPAAWSAPRARGQVARDLAGGLRGTAHVLRSWVEQAMAAGEPLKEDERIARVHGGRRHVRSRVAPIRGRHRDRRRLRPEGWTPRSTRAAVIEPRSPAVRDNGPEPSSAPATKRGGQRLAQGTPEAFVRRTACLPAPATKPALRRRRRAVRGAASRHARRAQAGRPWPVVGTRALRRGLAEAVGQSRARHLPDGRYALPDRPGKPGGVSGTRRISSA